MNTGGMSILCNHELLSEDKPNQRSDMKSAPKSTSNKIDAETAKMLSSGKEKANKKQYGRKVWDTEIIAAEQIVLLQEKTYSQQARLNFAHEVYLRQKGKISFNSFVRKPLKGEIRGPRILGLRR